MSFDAKVLEVMIASPGYLDAERDAVEAVIADWNALHAQKEGVILLPRRWERDGRVNLDGRAQQMINDDILANSDIVVGLFHARLGSPTGVYESGTVEEIKRHHEAKRPVILFFSSAPIPQDKIDTEQLKGVNDFKGWAQKQGITGSFADVASLKAALGPQLWQTLNKNQYIKGLTSTDFIEAFEQELKAAPGSTSKRDLSDAAKAIIQAAASSDDGMILMREYIGGNDLGAGDNTLMRNGSAREVARWKGALRDLRSQGLIHDDDGKGVIFNLTDSGYEVADQLDGEVS